MVIIGLDLSLTSTGIAHDDTIEGITPKMKGEQRLVFIRDAVREITRGYPDPLIVIEGYSFGSKNSNAHSIGELGGVVKTDFYEAGIPFVVVPPTCRAKFATGKGNASKSEVVSAISARTGITWAGKSAEDLCDSWILQEMGLVRAGQGRFEWPKTHLEGMDKVVWTPLDQLLKV